MSALSTEPDAGQQLPRLAIGFVLGDAAHLDRPEGDIGQRRHVREEIELLKDHRRLGADPSDVLLARRDEAAVALPIADQLVIDINAAALIRLQEVDATQQGGLAGAAGADDADHFARLDLEVDPLEHFEVAVPLVDVLDADHRMPIARNAGRGMIRLGMCVSHEEDPRQTCHVV